MQLILPAGGEHAAVDIDAAMVDLDGTMVNTLGDFVEALNRMLADLQLPSVTADAVEHMVGKGSEHLIRSVLAHVGASLDETEHAAEQTASVASDAGLV